MATDIDRAWAQREAEKRDAWRDAWIEHRRRAQLAELAIPTTAPAPPVREREK